MAFKKKKKVEEPVIEEVKDEITEEDFTESNDEIIEKDFTDEISEEPEVTIDLVDEIPEDAEVVETVVIEPVEEESDIVRPLAIGDRVKLIKLIDYSGRPVAEEFNKIYSVYSIHGDKVILKDRGLIGISTKIDNLKRV